MTEVEESLETLIDALLESPEYNEYHEAQQRIDGFPELRDKVNEYRRRNFELQQTIEDPGRLFAETDKLENEFDELRSDPVVHHFLESELAFVRMMQMVYGRIMEELDFEI